VARRAQRIRHHRLRRCCGRGVKRRGADLASHRAHYGHEELYLVLEGRARFLFDDDTEIEVEKHELLFVQPILGRGAIALETPTKLFIAGGKPGAYDPPAWANDWRPSA
jgi:hypothetical protein